MSSDCGAWFKSRGGAGGEGAEVINRNQWRQRVNIQATKTDTKGVDGVLNMRTHGERALAVHGDISSFIVVSKRRVRSGQ